MVAQGFICIKKVGGVQGTNTSKWESMEMGTCRVSLLIAFSLLVKLEVKSLTERENGKERFDIGQERKDEVEECESKWVRKYDCLTILRAHIE